MEKITHENGKVSWVGVKESDIFSPELFHKVDMSYSETDTQDAFHSNIGSVTILDRVTGFGFGVRDVETGFRAPDGKFWLASGNFDVRDMNCKTIGDAIECIKRNANNMRGE